MLKGCCIMYRPYCIVRYIKLGKPIRLITRKHANWKQYNPLQNLNFKRLKENFKKKRTFYRSKL